MLNTHAHDSSDDEHSSLLRNQITSSAIATRQNSVPRRSSGHLNEATKPQRFRDIRICYFGMFISSVVFSITVSSLWPYLHKIDPNSDTSFFGIVVAAFSIGQLISSPILGYIANRTNNNKIPLVTSTTLIVVANLLYAYIESIHNFLIPGRWWLFIARFTMGVGSGNSAVMRSYAASATTLTERTAVMANMSAVQGIGFILGPLIQAIFTLIDKIFQVKSPWFPFNLYTAPGHFNALTAAINVVLFAVAFRDVRVVSVQRKSLAGNESINGKSKELQDEEQDQFLALLCCLYMFFITYITFTSYEVIGSPLSIDMYGWNTKQSTLYNGGLLGGLGVMSVGIIILTKVLTRRFQDRTLLLAGIITCFVGYFVLLPWGDIYPATQIATVSTRPPLTTTPFIFNETTSTTTPSPTTTAPADDVGCPLNYEWCEYVPIVRLWQYILASVVITIGFSICNVICFSIVSKKLGHRPQGTIMGIMNSVGAGARAVGPITVGYVYAHDGPRVLFIFMLGVILTSFIPILFNFRRMYIAPEPPEGFEDDLEEGEVPSNGDDYQQGNRQDRSED